MADNEPTPAEEAGEDVAMVETGDGGAGAGAADDAELLDIEPETPKLVLFSE